MLQLKIDCCHRDDAEQLSTILEETSAQAITFTDQDDDPILEPKPGTSPFWPNMIVFALYEDLTLAQ